MLGKLKSRLTLPQFRPREDDHQVEPDGKVADPETSAYGEPAGYLPDGSAYYRNREEWRADGNHSRKVRGRKYVPPGSTPRVHQNQPDGGFLSPNSWHRARRHQRAHDQAAIDRARAEHEAGIEPAHPRRESSWRDVLGDF